jgi:hypothetical protein
MVLNRTSQTVGALLLLAACGCTSLREIPRSDYTSEPERRNVRIETREGLEYEFDFARFSADSMTGFRRIDVAGPVDTYAEVSLGYGDLSRLAMRRVDWYRTGLIGGGALVAVVAAGLSATTRSDDGGGSGGGGGRPPNGL